MRFIRTELPGAWIVELEPIADERGYFARSFCKQEFEEHGLDPRVVQMNVSRNARAGTLRGMHMQVAPHGETKLIRCTRGAIFDVIVDLREGSPAHARWTGVELSAETGRMLYVPRGFLHGFITLVDDTEVTYSVSERYAPDAERGARWDDPVFAIEWPLEPTVMSEKDRSWADFRE